MKKASKKTALPDDFQITEDLREWAQRKVSTLDIDYYHDEFVDYFLAHGKQMINWSATWRNWMRRADKETFGKAVRKKPTLVHSNSSISVLEERHQLIDKIRNQAIALGLDIHTAKHMSPTELKDYVSKTNAG